MTRRKRRTEAREWWEGTRCQQPCRTAVEVALSFPGHGDADKVVVSWIRSLAPHVNASCSPAPPLRAQDVEPQQPRRI